MNASDQNLFSVEKLLEEARFSPTPAFQDRLYTRLKQQLSTPRMESLPEAYPRLSGSHNGRKHLAWRWVFSAAVLFCLAFVSLVTLVPAVQAQVISLMQHFGVQLPFMNEGVVISPFTPLAPETIPAKMGYFYSLNQETSGSVYIELRYFSQDTFVVIYETPMQAGEVLPQGKPIHIGQNDAVMDTNLDGLVLLAAQAPQPWRQAGNGGGGGGSSDETSGTPPQQIIYHSGTRLTWMQSGLHIELFTNLPQDEALSLAATLRPAPQLKKP